MSNLASPMNVFSSDAFLGALASTYYPGRPAEIALHTVAGHTFRLLRIGKRPVVSPPLVDFWEPVTAVDGWGRVPYPVRYLPRAALTSVEVAGHAPSPDGTALAPFVDLGAFPTWRDLQEFVRGRRRELFKDSRRQVRRLQRDLGALVFTSEDPDDAVVDRCVAWRSQRFRSAARAHRDARHAVFMRALRDAGLARVSSLRVSDTLLAGSLSFEHDRRLSYWIAAYDPSYGTYSPGRLLLEHVMEASLASGDAEFDFLIGSESYKWLYATHARVVGPLGSQPPLPAAAMAVRRRLRLGRKYLRLREVLRV